MRAWIEIAEGFELSEFESVALFMRAWIEIFLAMYSSIFPESPSS